MSNSRAGEDNFLAMTVHNTGFLLDRMGQDCHPLQYLRELTQNSIEAIVRTKKSGEIVWDLDWTAFDLDGQQKICITDTGDGMTGEEMVRFINQLSSSIASQSFSGNYGVGAKISAVTRNPEGVVYLSWKNGEGSMIQLYRNRTSGEYGLKQWKHRDGSYAHYLPLEDEIRPNLIEGHGTKVLLMGKDAEESTMSAPPNTPSPSRWISKYLNTRYFRFPNGITIKAREGWEYPRSDTDRNYLRKIMGQEAYLQQHCTHSGTVALTNASAHWWILKDETAITNNSGFIESSGHIGALYQDELYELATARAAMNRLQLFGIVFGYRFVVIYVEPHDVQGQNLTTNTSRTLLLINSESVPWSDWATEFREKLPPELEALVAEKAAAASNTDHAKSIRDRLRDLMDLFKVSRYRPTPDGDVNIDRERLARGGRVPDPIRTSTTSTSGGKSSGAGGSTGNVYSVFEKTDGAAGKQTNPDPFPLVSWVSVANGTREHGDIEDRAAKFLVDQNLLLANSDFRVFKDMVAFFAKGFAGVPAIESVAEEAVRGWYEQALVEAVMGVQSLINSKEWLPTDIEKALSEEALTTAVMQRYHVHFAVKRELSSKLGSRRA